MMCCCCWWCVWCAYVCTKIQQIHFTIIGSYVFRLPTSRCYCYCWLLRFCTKHLHTKNGLVHFYRSNSQLNEISSNNIERNNVWVVENMSEVKVNFRILETKLCGNFVLYLLEFKSDFEMQALAFHSDRFSIVMCSVSLLQCGWWCASREYIDRIISTHSAASILYIWTLPSHCYFCANTHALRALTIDTNFIEADTNFYLLDSINM